MSKTVKVIFTLSVMLNVLLLGLGGGYAYKKMNDKPWHQAQKNMPPDIQAMMEKNYQAMRANMETLNAQSQQAHEELGALLKSKQFDPQRFDQIASRISDLRKKMGDERMRATRTLVVQLSPEQRQKMADHFAGRWDWRRNLYWTCHPKQMGSSPSADIGRPPGPPPGGTQEIRHDIPASPPPQ